MKSGRLETQDSLEEIVPKQENILKKIYIKSAKNDLITTNLFFWQLQQ